MVSFGGIARKIFGNSNDRRLKSAQPKVAAINALEAEMEALSDEALKAKTDEFRAQLKDGKTLDDLLVPAFAVVREAARRALGLRPFDVQLIGGMVLHQGAIAEMRTGEGKTLVATLPVYLNALAGGGVHVVTVNDYLAQRDAEWMGAIYKFLGLTVGVIVHGLDDEQRKAAYDCDVTYATNNELGFDYLRDNMKYERAQMVQREHVFAIVDEVDSILIDEARTPLDHFRPAGRQAPNSTTPSTSLHSATCAGRRLRDSTRRQRSATFTEGGQPKSSRQLLSEAEPAEGRVASMTSKTSPSCTTCSKALKAHKLFQRDKDYIVKQRRRWSSSTNSPAGMMPGRRFSEGLHQALEAKEKACRIQPENQTLASVTFQNYFRMYDKLAGMTGTASTEAEEFMRHLRLEVVDIPTNVAVQRIDDDDEVYRTVTEEKYRRDRRS